MTKTTTKVRAEIGREKRLALALRAVLDDTTETGGNYGDAEALLIELGYSALESIPKRVAAINVELTEAVAAGDGARIAELGKALALAKAGRSYKLPAKPKPRKQRSDAGTQRKGNGEGEAVEGSTQ